MTLVAYSVEGCHLLLLKTDFTEFRNHADLNRAIEEQGNASLGNSFNSCVHLNNHFGFRTLGALSNRCFDLLSFKCLQ
jgi:hypothetical protein